MKLKEDLSKFGKELSLLESHSIVIYVKKNIGIFLPLRVLVPIETLFLKLLLVRNLFEIVIREGRKNGNIPSHNQ